MRLHVGGRLPVGVARSVLKHDPGHTYTCLHVGGAHMRTYLWVWHALC